MWWVCDHCCEAYSYKVEKVDNEDFGVICEYCADSINDEARETAYAEMGD